MTEVHEAGLAALRSRHPGMNFTAVEGGREVRFFAREGERTVCIVDIERGLLEAASIFDPGRFVVREVERVMAEVRAAA